MSSDPLSPPLSPPLPRTDLMARYRQVRSLTERLAAPLSEADQLLQSMPACSPTKWHRAHTTWFFETFVLARLGLPPLDGQSTYLWNSYYEAIGARHPRPQRGMLSRPSAAAIGEYRAATDERVLDALSSLDEARLTDITPLVLLGLAHEQQHQELILTDILHALSLNPLRPAYREPVPYPAARPSPLAFVPFDGGLVSIGADGSSDFAFDNEGPRHRVWLEPFALATRLVTVGEMRAFIEAGGYATPSLWLSEGWDWLQRESIRAPLYVELADGYRVFGLEGMRTPDDAEPVAHVSYYEADALARFLGARLPSEAEWEHAAQSQPVVGHLLDLARPLHALPAASPEGDGPTASPIGQVFGDAWIWTRSAYAPYPGYSAGPGALGEYNGKFMVNQLVLRGGSCFTPAGHVRASYRNFWYPDTRFQATGVRLARDRA